MAAWRASVGAWAMVVASATSAAAASPIAELERLLQQEQASQRTSVRTADSGWVVSPAAQNGPAGQQSNAYPWNYAVLERDRNFRRAAIDPQTPSMAVAPPAESNSEFNNSVGCIVGGALGTTVASLAGGLNTVNLIGGGIVSAVNPVTFYVSLMGVVFVSFCQMGQALTPLYTYLTTPTPPEPIIGVPELVPEPQQPLDNLPDFRRGVPYESRPGVPMVRAADQPVEWVPVDPAPRRNCVQDRRSIRLAMSAMIHGEVIPPSCSGSLI